MARDFIEYLIEYGVYTPLVNKTPSLAWFTSIYITIGYYAFIASRYHAEIEPVLTETVFINAALLQKPSINSKLLEENNQMRRTKHDLADIKVKPIIFFTLTNSAVLNNQLFRSIRVFKGIVHQFWINNIFFVLQQKKHFL